MQRKRITSEVAPLVGLEHQSLINYLARHPELKPGERLPNDDYLWSEEEIQRVVEARAQGKKYGRRENAHR